MPITDLARKHPLQKWLDKNDKTQAWLSGQSGAHWSTISQIINRRRGASPELALKIERATGHEVLATALLYPEGYP